MTQIANMMMTMATNCSSTRSRISFCEVLPEPPRIMLMRPSSSTTATAPMAIGTRPCDRKVDMPPLVDEAAGAAKASTCSDQGPSPETSSAESLTNIDLLVDGVKALVSVAHILRKRSRRTSDRGILRSIGFAQWGDRYDDLGEVLA